MSTRSRLLLHWRSHLGTTKTVNGVAPVFTRAATLGSTAGNGTAWTALNGQPAWYWADSRPHWLMGASDIVYFPFYALPQTLWIYTKLRMLQAVGSADASYGVLYLGNAANTGARVSVHHASGTAGFIGYHHNGATAVTTATGTTAPAVNDYLELLLPLSGAGVVQVTQSINGATTTQNTASGALALGSAWGDTRLYVNGIGETSRGSAAYEIIKVGAGSVTMAQARVAY